MRWSQGTRAVTPTVDASCLRGAAVCAIGQPSFDRQEKHRLMPGPLAARVTQTRSRLGSASRRSAAIAIRFDYGIFPTDQIHCSTSISTVVPGVPNDTQ